MHKGFKTTAATMRQALVSKNVYLPNHRRNYTSIYYMKKILSGTIKYLTVDMVK